MAEVFGTSAPYAEPLWYSRAISPYYGESHRRLRQEARRYVDHYIAPYVEQWEKQGSIPEEVYQRHAKMGYVAQSVYPIAEDCMEGVSMPADIPVKQWDGFHDLIVIDEIARSGYLGFVWGINCGNCVGLPPVVNFGTAEQKRRFIPDVLKGKKRFCLGVTEPSVGSDVASVSTKAVRRGDVYVVNGAKKWITNGMWSDYCTAAVRTGGPGQGGISALVIPMKAKGVTCRKIENSGVNCSGSTWIEFDDVEVPAENLLGKENEGFKIFMSNFNHERLWLACTSLRLARIWPEDAYQHAITRETFGKKLIENQLIRSKISSFGRYIEPAHAYMEQLVYLLEDAKKNNGRQDPRIGGLTANLKVMAARALEHVTRESQQIFGGLGYSKYGRGGRVEQISRDVRIMVVGGGSDEILQDLAVKEEIKLRAQL